MWNEIIYPIPNLNGVAVEVLEWKSNFIPHFTGHMITSAIDGLSSPGDSFS